MIKIYKDFFDSDCLEYIEEQIKRSKNTNNLRTTYPQELGGWPHFIVHNSTPVMIYDIPDNGPLTKRLSEVIDIKNEVHFMIYYWPTGSYIPWHNDGHAEFTATVYMNKFWDRDWGGLFLYEEGDKILAEVPEWNKLVIQRETTMHSTTSISKPYYTPKAIVGGYGYNMFPEIRTTVQIFELKKVNNG